MKLRVSLFLAALMAAFFMAVPADAAPVIGAVVAAGIAFASEATIFGLVGWQAAALIGLANLAMGFISQMMTPKPKAPELGSLSFSAPDRTQMIKQPITYRRGIYGRTKVSGPLTFIHTTDNNKTLHLVITLSGHPLEGPVSLWFDDEEITWNQSTGACGGRWNNYAWAWFGDGSYDGSGDAAFHAALSGACSDKWTSNHKQLGCGKIYIRWKHNSDLFDANMPTVRVVVDGKATIFDPRTSTTAFSANAVLCIRDFLADPYWGLGEAGLDDDENEASANVADEDVTLKAGGTEKRYVAHGTFEANEQPREIIARLLTACAGEVTWAGGQYAVLAGYWRAPDVTLTSFDIDGPFDVIGNLSRDDLCNGVKGIYVSQSGNWQPTDFPAVTSATYLARDNGERLWKDIELQYTISTAAAQRLAKIELESRARQKTVNLPCRLTANTIKIKTGTIVNFTYPRFGFSAKTFKCVSWKFSVKEDGEKKPYLGVDLVLREWDSAIYTWDSAADEITVSPPSSTTLPDPFTVEAPSGVTCASGVDNLLSMGDGTQVARIKVDWSDPINGMVLDWGVAEIRYRISGAADWIAAPPVVGAVGPGWISPVQDGDVYEVQVRFVNSLRKKSTWTAAANHTVVGKDTFAADVTGFSAQQSGGSVNFRCNPNTEADNNRIEIRFNAVGNTDFASATPVANVLRGHAFSSGVVPPGDWTFLAKAFDTSGNQSVNAARFDLTVENAFDVVLSSEQAPRWLGTKTNFLKHWTGVLVPSSTKSASELTNAELFTQFCPYPSASCTYEAPEQDLGFDADGVRVWADISSALGPGVTTGLADPTLSIDYRDEAASYDGFENWTIGTTNFRRIKGKLTLTPALGNAKVTGFNLVCDVAERTENGAGTAAISGTRVNYAQRFFLTPNPQVTASSVSGAARYATWQDADESGFTVFVFDETGAAVGGPFTWFSTGA